MSLQAVSAGRCHTQYLCSPTEINQLCFLLFGELGVNQPFKQENSKEAQSFTRRNLRVMVQIMKLDFSSSLYSAQGAGVQVEVECLPPESPQTHGQLASHKEESPTAEPDSHMIIRGWFAFCVSKPNCLNSRLTILGWTTKMSCI